VPAPPRPLSAPRPRRLRRRLLLALLAGTLLAVAGNCALSLPSFDPEVASSAMQVAALASRFVPSEAGELHVVAAGSAGAGATVLCIHGSPGTWDACRGVLEDADLRARARLLAYDRPGFGASSRGRAEPSLARQAAAAAAVLEAEGAAPAVVVGHSVGGAIAARLAMDRPDLVGGLVLIAPSIDPALERRRWFNVAGSWRLVQLLLPVDWITSNRELWPLRAELEQMLPLWVWVTAPTIVVQGLADQLVPAANADFAERQLASAPLDVRRYQDDGHFILWQRPAEVRAAIITVLHWASRPASADGG
jgi:pimeloyl-ACP methyl ester carboxylesterase